MALSRRQFFQASATALATTAFGFDLSRAASRAKELGNIGMPGGGVNARRGHSNIQGATDMGAWNMLPGYIKVPRADWQSLEDYVDANSPRPLRPNALNYWSNMSKFIVSHPKGLLRRQSDARERFRLRKSSEGRRERQFRLGVLFRSHAPG